AASRRMSGPRRPRRFAHTRPPSQRARKGAAIEQDVLSGNEACFRAAQKSASKAKFLRVAEASGGVEFGAFRQQLIDTDAALVCIQLRHRASQPIGIERP